MRIKPIVCGIIAALVTSALFAISGFGKPVSPQAKSSERKGSAIKPPYNKEIRDKRDALMSECSPRVAKETMHAIVQVESEWKPYSININDGYKLKKQPTTQREAIHIAKELLKRGYRIDMGIGQISSGNLKVYNVNVEDVFDPCKNLGIAQKILAENYMRARKVHENEQRALQAAISAYNTGSPTAGVANGYVAKVYKARQRY